MATAHIDVDVDQDGRVYPIGSDTPVPAEAVRLIAHTKFILAIGDAVIDSSGQLWLAVEDRDPEFAPYPTIVLQSAQHPDVHRSIPALTTPAVRVYHCGEPRHDYIA